MKENDVYSFQFNEQELKRRSSPYHCFDGQLIAKKYDYGLMLVDTYWGFNSGSSKQFTISEINSLGTITFKCNLYDIVRIEEWETGYYDDSDIFNLSYQSGCYKFFAKKKNAIRSKSKMILTAKKKLEDMEYSKRNAENRIKELSNAIKIIESGDTTIYI